MSAMQFTYIISKVLALSILNMCKQIIGFLIIELSARYLHLFTSAALYHLSCFVGVVIVAVCHIDWYTVWIFGAVVCHGPSECIRMSDFGKSDKKSGFPKICNG